MTLQESSRQGRVRGEEETGSRPSPDRDPRTRPGPISGFSFVERAPAASQRTIVNALTVDVEDYYQVSAFDKYLPRSEWSRMPARVEENTRRLLDLFDHHGTEGTFFVLGCVAERFPTLAREISERGHEVASHGWSHLRVEALTRQEFRREAHDSKQLLENQSGNEVRGFRAPNFSIGPDTIWALEILVEEGYGYDSSVRELFGGRFFPRFPARLTTPAGEIEEFPFPTMSLFGQRLPFTGGNYLRQFPLWLSRHGLQSVNERCRQPIMLYVHPWEVDPDQPRIEVDALTALRHYRNLRHVHGKLRRLLATHRFGSMTRVLDDSAES